MANTFRIERPSDSEGGNESIMALGASWRLEAGNSIIIARESEQGVHPVLSIRRIRNYRDYGNYIIRRLQPVGALRLNTEELAAARPWQVEGNTAHISRAEGMRSLLLAPSAAGGALYAATGSLVHSDRERFGCVTPVLYDVYGDEVLDIDMPQSDQLPFEGIGRLLFYEASPPLSEAA